MVGSVNAKNVSATPPGDGPLNLGGLPSSQPEDTTVIPRSVGMGRLPGFKNERMPEVIVIDDHKKNDIKLGIVYTSHGGAVEATMKHSAEKNQLETPLMVRRLSNQDMANAYQQATQLMDHDAFNQITAINLSQSISLRDENGKIIFEEPTYEEIASILFPYDKNLANDDPVNLQMNAKYKDFIQKIKDGILVKNTPEAKLIKQQIIDLFKKNSDVKIVLDAYDKMLESARRHGVSVCVSSGNKKSMVNIFACYDVNVIGATDAQGNPDSRFSTVTAKEFTQGKFSVTNYKENGEIKFGFQPGPSDRNFLDSSSLITPYYYNGKEISSALIKSDQNDAYNQYAEILVYPKSKSEEEIKDFNKKNAGLVFDAERLAKACKRVADRVGDAQQFQLNGVNYDVFIREMAKSEGEFVVFTGRNIKPDFYHSRIVDGKKVLYYNPGNNPQNGVYAGLLEGTSFAVPFQLVGNEAIKQHARVGDFPPNIINTNG